MVNGRPLDSWIAEQPFGIKHARARWMTLPVPFYDRSRRVAWMWKGCLAEVEECFGRCLPLPALQGR